MIHARLRLFSESLGFHTSVTLLLPAERLERPAQVLWLLHGRSDDDTSWHARTSLERYAEGRGLAVVMPFGGIDYYCDVPGSSQWWTWLSQELPEVLHRSFTWSTAREDTFAAGLSMGGFGAMKLALNQPERFAAAATFSGALNQRAERYLTPDYLPRTRRIWGEQGAPAGGIDDLVTLVGRVPREQVPALYLACGLEDYLLQESQDFEAAARAAGVPIEAHYGPGGHEWPFWDAHIQRVLDWLPLRTN